jgi:glycerol-3-phosphate acyltransferase PlsX
MSEQIIVAVDAVGGDIGPSVVLPGVESALNADENLIVLLCGPAEVVEPFAASHERCEAVACSQIITMEEHPASAVRQKKDEQIDQFLATNSKLIEEIQRRGERVDRLIDKLMEDK